MLDAFNPIDGLHVWIKVPKGGKVKKGWKRLYMAFLQDKLFTFETEEDFSTESKGTFICDLTCEIFVARSVTQNELIHANAKDIDMIFRIQAYHHSENVGDVADLEEREKRIATLKNSIELEERMLEGVNKILAVTTDAQKVTVIGQIDAANKRLRSFKLELQKLTENSKRGNTIVIIIFNIRMERRWMKRRKLAI
jgi:hypothetical protein